MKKTKLLLVLLCGIFLIIGKTGYSQDTIKKTGNTKEIKQSKGWNLTITPEDRNTYNIQKINLNLKKSKEGFVIAGLLLVAGGACAIIAATDKPPSLNEKDYQNKLDVYNNKQQTLKIASSGCNVLAGISIIIGVSINF